MELLAFEPSVDIYNQYDFITESDTMNNRLFATFTQQNHLDELISNLSTTYDIMYNKMFVLFVKSTNEYVVTYNVEQGNINGIPANTIFEVYSGAGNKITVAGSPFTALELGTASSAQEGVIGGGA
jgi:hypothetical protein